MIRRDVCMKRVSARSAHVAVRAAPLRPKCARQQVEFAVCCQVTRRFVVSRRVVWVVKTLASEVHICFHFKHLGPWIRYDALFHVHRDLCKCARCTQLRIDLTSLIIAANTALVHACSFSPNSKQYSNLKPVPHNSDCRVPLPNFNSYTEFAVSPKSGGPETMENNYE